ncbi:hypothetical protein F2Q70_00013819 [Brassica cretica]|uniref:Uncharacterized protein n=1 Tax=Brassica cretica TaxID=69181 RepID=A0A8S9LTU2_BRACR|nr:hypothetical protein F2Q70_00013819 [Brassica cretica]
MGSSSERREVGFLLLQNGSNRVVTCIAHDLKWSDPFIQLEISELASVLTKGRSCRSSSPPSSVVFSTIVRRLLHHHPSSSPPSSSSTPFSTIVVVVSVIVVVSTSSQHLIVLQFRFSASLHLQVVVSTIVRRLLHHCPSSSPPSSVVISSIVVVDTILHHRRRCLCHRRRLHFVTASHRPSVSFLSISASSREADERMFREANECVYRSRDVVYFVSSHSFLLELFCDLNITAVVIL